MKTGTGLKYFSRDFFRAAMIIWRAGKGMAVMNIILQFLLALMPVFSLYFLKVLVELITAPAKPGFDKILPIVIGFCLIQFLIAALNQFSNYINTLQQQKITDYISALVLNKAVSTDLEYYENPHYHDSLHLAQQQSQYRVPQLVTNINALMLHGLSLLFLISYFFTLQWSYALLFIALSVPLAVIKWYYSYQLYRLEKKFVPMEREAGYFHQLLTGANYAKEVRAFGFAGSFIRKFQDIRAVIYAGKKGLHTKLNSYIIITQVFEVVAMSFIFIMLANQAWIGVISAGVFVVYLQGFQKLQGTSKNFLQSFIQVFQQRLFLKDIFLFLDIKPVSKKGDNPFPELKEGLFVKNLSFTYPQTCRQVLSNISISCKPGKIIAIVGENGSGKSTLVKLLARLYSIQSGSVRIDQSDASDISIDSFTENTFFLFQDFEKYFLTIEENIVLAAAGEKNDAAINQAASLAGADEFIAALPDGYKTRLGRTFHESAQLSGGQWQKIALARMFYKNAQLIVLDEPTSFIDAIAEHDLYKNLKEHAKDKIVVLISHRLYNLKIADHIYVMKHGRIAEEGSFDTLLASNGIFKQMFDNQKL